MTSKPAEFWTSERLEQALCDEAARHGANERNLDLLRTEYQRLCESNKTNNQSALAQVEIPDDTVS